MDDDEQARKAAELAGIDLTLVDSNLQLTVEERWRRHDAALNLALELRRNLKVTHAETRGAANTAR